MPSAIAVAEAIDSALAGPFAAGDTTVRLTASTGIAIADSDDHSDAENLLGHATVAVYRAKSAGGGQLAFADSRIAAATR